MAVRVEMTGDEGKLIRSLAKVEAANEKLQQKLAKTGRTGKKAGDDLRKSMKRATSDGFGRVQIAKIKGYTTGLVGISAAIAAISSGFRFMKSESTAALSTLRSLTNERIRLNQIATSPEDLKKLDTLTDDLAQRFSVKRNVVKQVLFSARSEGFEPSVEFILANSQVIDPLTQASLAGQLPGLFPSKGLRPQAAINLALVGAKQSRLNVEQLAAVLPAIAEGANPAGSSIEETIALASVFAGRTASGQTGADRGKAFGAKVAISDQLRGKGIVGAFKALRDDFTEEQRRKFLGESQELNSFYQILGEEVGEVEKRTLELEQERLKTGTAGSAIMLARERARQSGPLSTVKRLDRSEIRRDVARERRLAADRGEIEAVRNVGIAIIDEQGGSPAQKFGYKALSEAAEFMGASPDTVRASGTFGAYLLTNQFDQDQRAAVQGLMAASAIQEAVAEANLRAAENLAETTKNLEEVTKKLERSLGGGPAMQSPRVDK